MRDGVKQRLDRAQTASDPEGDGDGRIEMATGNVSYGGDHDRDGEAVSDRESEEGDATLSRGAEILVGADYASGEEDYGESAEEFGEEFLGEAVHACSQEKRGANRLRLSRARF